MRRRHTTNLAAFVALFTATTLGAIEPPRAPQQFALLVGCTEYQSNRIPELWGPANDGPAWAKLLNQQFGFAEANVTQLIGPPKDPSKIPTRANIVKGFETLIAMAGTGDKVFILLSGHGTQIPVPQDQDPLNPKNFEPDGLDEVFLPVDVKVENEQLQNHILDNEIGGWLNKIRVKGADVFVVFDCCHAGTMTRGGPLDVERNRTIRPQELGVPDTAISDAVARAEVARKKAEKDGRNPEAGAAKVRPRNDPKSQGSLVAFYAAQPFQAAPELPLPEGARPARENYFGMLSWTLIQALRDSRGVLTYRELEQVVAARYRGVRGTRDPIPYAEGDTDREVLGFVQWPNRGTILLQVAEGKPLRVSAGALAGLTPGTVLAVSPPVIDPKKRDPKEVIGYVKVGEKPTAYEAHVVPVDFERPSPTDPNKMEKVLAPKPEDLDDLCRCAIVARDYGEMRVKLLLPNDAAVKEAFAGVDKEVREMLLPIPSEKDAEWVLKVVSPEVAVKEYGFKKGLTGDHVLLVRASGHAIDRDEEKLVAEQLAKTGQAPPRRVFGAYPVGNANQLTANLERDLQKVFKWQNVWKVAAGLVSETSGSSLGVTLETRRLKNEKDAKGELLRSGGAVPNKGHLGFVVKNGGKHDVWVVALWLDAELGIYEYEVLQVQAYQDGRLSSAQIDNGPDARGTEGLILFVFSQAVQRERPDFKFLSQSPLRVDEKLKRGDNMTGAPNSPFGDFVSKATLFHGERGPLKTEPTTPAVIVQTWFVTPEQK